MKHASIRPSRQNKNRPAQNLYQSSRSRYLRAFASARAMRFWRPRITGKNLTVAAVFTAALAMGPSTTQAQFPASFDLSILNGTNGFVINGFNTFGVDPAGNAAGADVSDVGDFNGDGIDDVVVSERFDNGAGFASFIDSSYIVFGSNGGGVPSVNLGSLNGTLMVCGSKYVVPRSVVQAMSMEMDSMT